MSEFLKYLSTLWLKLSAYYQLRQSRTTIKVTINTAQYFEVSSQAGHE